MAFSVWSLHSFFTQRCLDSELSLSEMVKWGLVSRCFWEAVGTPSCRWLSHGWLLDDSVVLALQSSVLHSGNLLQWTRWGQGLCWTRVGFLPSWHPTVLQGMDRTGEILKAALGNFSLHGNWPSSCLELAQRQFVLVLMLLELEQCIHPQCLNQLF